MTEKEQKENHPTFNNIWEEFRETTGFHGVNKIGLARNSKPRTCIWICFWLFSASYVIYIVTTELKHYYQYPTTVTVTSRVEEKLEFPAVVICNLATRNKKAFSNDPRIRSYFLSIGKLMQEQTVNWSDPFFVKEGYFENRKIEDLYSESKNISEFIIYKRFDNEAKWFSVLPYATNIGLCAKVLVDKSKYTQFHGALNNLQMFIDLQLDMDFYNYHYLSSGLKIAVYDRHEEPEINSKGIFVPPASEAYIEVSRKEYKYLPEPYKAFENGICEQSEPDYSNSKCFKECIRLKMLKRCNCVDFEFDSPDGQYCSREQYYNCFYNTYWEVLQNETESCVCPVKCEFIKYETSMTFGHFPSEFMLEPILTIFNKSEEYVRKNYISLNIFYKDLQTTVTEQKPKYETVGDVCSNIGGQMGLFLGASILTAMELAEFILFVLCHIFGRLFKRTFF